ncbi:hypothetical protein Tco_0570844 [Tanacetum coccineum]
MPLTLKMELLAHTIVDQFPTPREMVWIKALTNDQLTAKMTVEESSRKFLTSDEFSRVQGKLLSLAASAGFERGLSVDRIQEEVVGVLKKNFRFVPGAHGRLVKASPLMAMTDYPFFNKVSDCASHPLSAILQLEPEKLARSHDVSNLKDTRVSPPIAKESIVTPLLFHLLVLLREKSSQDSSYDDSKKFSSFNFSFPLHFPYSWVIFFLASGGSEPSDAVKDRGPESPPELRRSWYVEGHIRFEVISSVLMQWYLRTIRKRSFYQAQAAHVNLPQHLAPSVGLGIPIYPKKKTEEGMVDSQHVEEEF